MLLHKTTKNVKKRKSSQRVGQVKQREEKVCECFFVARLVGQYRERTGSKISTLKLPPSIFSQCINIRQRKKCIPKRVKQHRDFFFLFEITEYICSVHMYLLRKIFSKKKYQIRKCPKSFVTCKTFLSSYNILFLPYKRIYFKIIQNLLMLKFVCLQIILQYILPNFLAQKFFEVISLNHRKMP